MLTALHLKPVTYYLKLFAITLIVTVFSLIFLAGGLIGIALTLPLKSKICCETPARFGAGYESVHFSTADGLTLSGWYVQPKNGAVVILVHGYYGDRRQTLPVAAMLFKHGYGLLMYDQRASGESQGETRSLGRLDIPDLAQAANYLITRQKDLKIGVYGCSMGGAISLAGSVNVPTLQAIAVDAPSPLSWDENRPPFSWRDPLSLPIAAIYFQLVTLRTQAQPPTSTLQAAQDFGNRPILFISTGQDGEQTRIDSYFNAAVGPKEHWNLPDASHCAAPGTHPAEYEQHLVEFFDTHLLLK